MQNIIATLIFIIIIAAIAGLVAYEMYKKNNNNLTINEFIEVNHDKLIKALQDAVILLLINIDNFSDKESYERTIISTTIEKINENCIEFGINTTLFGIFDVDILTEMLYSLLHKEEIEIYSVAVPKTILEAKPELYNDEVIEAARSSSL